MIELLNATPPKCEMEALQPMHFDSRDLVEGERFRVEQKFVTLLTLLKRARRVEDVAPATKRRKGGT